LGIRWRQVEYETPFGVGHYTEIAEHPLAGDKLYQYVPPDPYREELYTPLGRVMEKYGEKYFILGVTVCTILRLPGICGGWINYLWI